jgi:hypothetical protein
MKEQKVHEVYLHRNPVTKEVFYVGSGKWHKYTGIRRATQFDKSCSRPKAWFKVVNQFGLPLVEILADNLSKKDSIELEELITEEYFEMGAPLVNVNIGKTPSAETKVKMSESHEKHIVNQYSKDGTFLKQYTSLNEAYRQTGVDFGNIRHCCRGHYKTAGGYIWQYENNQTTN